MSADAAERLARQAFEALAVQVPIEHEARLAQLEQRDARVSAALRDWMIAAEARHKAVVKAAGNGQWTSPPAMPTSVLPMLKAVAAGLQETATALTNGLQPDQKEALQAEQRELKAREQLSLIRNGMLRRIQDLKREAALRNCIQATSTTAITRRAGEFSEKYLTPQVKELLEEEVEALNIGYLRPTLLRKPDNKGAQFKVELQADLKCRTSEAERRRASRACTRVVSDRGPVNV